MKVYISTVIKNRHKPEKRVGIGGYLNIDAIPEIGSHFYFRTEQLQVEDVCYNVNDRGWTITFKPYETDDVETSVERLNACCFNDIWNLTHSPYGKKFFANLFFRPSKSSKPMSPEEVKKIIEEHQRNIEEHKRKCRMCGDVDLTENKIEVELWVNGIWGHFTMNAVPPIGSRFCFETEKQNRVYLRVEEVAYDMEEGRWIVALEQYEAEKDKLVDFNRSIQKIDHIKWFGHDKLKRESNEADSKAEVVKVG